MDGDEIQDPEYTGPPLGPPPEHVHDNEPVTDALDDTAEEVDELTQAVTELQEKTGQNHSEILGRLDVCQNSLTRLAEQQTATESPMLVQIVTQLAALQSEVLNIRQELAMSMRNQLPSELPISSETPPESDSLETDGLTDEVPEEDAENIPQEVPMRKRRFR